MPHVETIIIKENTSVLAISQCDQGAKPITLRRRLQGLIEQSAFRGI
ncbi:MAG: hypothetical protein ACI9BW_003535, partial [Gammaproteobacteria bacterium]